ncbi:hypothetical protein L208DRAFT_627025 [Tricholoma matsutake]|nr:hypothetical protein L208DRAFT_627025 [Tricholoma matsutake 945]
MYTTSKPALLEVRVTSLRQSNNFSRQRKVTIRGLLFSSGTVIFKHCRHVVFQYCLQVCRS